MSNKFRSALILFFSVCLLAGPISCKNTGDGETKEPEARTPVTTVPVEFRTVKSGVDLPAVTHFMNKSYIRSTTTGVIQKMMIHQGDKITKGQVLFTIKTREAMAMGNSGQADSNLTFKGIISIRSNNGGIINSVSFQQGDFVQEGDQLASVDDQSSLIFILEVPFELERYINKNRQCNIELPDNSTITGIITGRMSEMDMQTQTVKYIIKPSRTAGLPANLIGNVRLVKSVIQNAAILPKGAVLGNETQTEFWIMKLLNDSTAVKILVQKGYEDNDEVQITEPSLSPSDRILVTGNYGLPDTASVSVKKE
ncbi:MAG TPA: HlyD family efflux transporter periplasmic adaptor subunit [Bacteroidales bacterium]|nr:HlyD family efflux transporter periplasmic adaptor subunit [Bacteroidales bacterium]